MISRTQPTKKWTHTNSAISPRGGGGPQLPGPLRFPPIQRRYGRRTVTRNTLPLNGSKFARRRRKAVPMDKHTANIATGVVVANKWLKQRGTAGSVGTRFHLSDKKGVLRVQRWAEMSPHYQQKKRGRFCCRLCPFWGWVWGKAAELAPAAGSPEPPKHNKPPPMQNAQRLRQRSVECHKKP